MGKKFCCFALSATLLALCFPAYAQQQAKVPKIGWLGARSASDPVSGYEILRRELRALGYVEGKNIAFEYRSAENKLDRLPALSDELVRLKVDVLLAAATTEALAAKNATKTIPIVFYGGFDSFAAGFVENLTRPGVNVTGITNLSRELGGKRLELLKETVPKVARVGVLYEPAIPGSVLEVKEVLPVAARALGLTIAWKNSFLFRARKASDRSRRFIYGEYASVTY